MCSPQSGSLRDVHGVTQRRKREEGDRGGQEVKGGGIKRGESNLASNQFPMCSHQSGTSREVHTDIWRREEGGGRIEVTMRRRGRVKGEKAI